MAQTIDHQRDRAGKSVWRRGLIMLFFVIAFAIAETVLAVLTLLQFVWLLTSGTPNPFIRDFGLSISKWVRDVVRYQVCATDEKPFPWTRWPNAHDNENQPDLFDGVDGS